MEGEFSGRHMAGKNSTDPKIAFEDALGVNAWIVIDLRYLIIFVRGADHLSLPGNDRFSIHTRLVVVCPLPGVTL